MRLCLSVYMQTLKAFKKSSTTQKELGNKLLKAVNPDNYIEYDDSQISDLFHGKKNAGPYEIAAAKNLDKESYLSCFFDKVMPLLSVGFQPHAIAAFKIIIASDSTISDSAELDFTSGLTKHEVLLSDSFCPHTLLAGLLLYALCETQNRGTQKFAAEINASFIERATKEAACITLLKSPGKQSHPFIELWRNGSGSISVKSGDIFSWASTSGNKRKCLLTIPVDTSFSTDLAVSIENSNPFLISENTLHGIFLKRHLYEEASLIDLKARIKTELNNSRIKKDEDGHYPIGSIAAIENEGITYCLLAISEQDENGNAQSSKEDIRQALDALLAFYDRRGLGYPLLIPLMGTGLSRASLNHQDSLELIFDQALKNKERIHGDVIICVLPEAYGDISIERLRRDHALQN